MPGIYMVLRLFTSMHKCLQAGVGVYTIQVKSSSYCQLEAKEHQALVQVISGVACI